MHHNWPTREANRETVRIFVFVSHTDSRKGRRMYGNEEILGAERRAA